MTLLPNLSARCCRALAGAVAAGLLGQPVAPAYSQSLLDVVHTIAAADQGVPVEYPFNISAPGTYRITLTDLGAQLSPAAPLASLKLAITTGSTIVGTPLTTAGTSSFTANTAGAYVVRVIGRPGAVPGSGPFGVTIVSTADNSQLVGFSATLALPSASTSNAAILRDTFTVPASDTYSVALTDLKFPQYLSTVQLALTTAGSQSLLGSLAVSNGMPAASQQFSVALQPSTTYDIFAFGGESGAVTVAGLYAVVVRNSSSAIVYSRTVPVGSVTPMGSAALAAGSSTLTYSDLVFPAALSAASPQGAVATLADAAAAVLTAPGSKAFTAVSGTYQVFALAAAGASPGGGSYDVDLRPTGAATAVLSAAQAVDAGGSLKGYTFSASVPTAGNYSIQLADYQVPQSLTSLSLAAVQGGTAVAGPLVGAGTAPVAATAGNMSVLVFAQAQSAGGVLGLFVTPAGGGSPILETTQGVGTVFASTKLVVGTAGSYVLQATDVGFPASFAGFNVLLTQGTTLIGSILGGGPLPFSATSGDYFVTFAAQAAAPDEAGTYALDVAPPPPAPTVTLSSSVSHVASGGSATLTWSTQNATACTASGGWSGSRQLSGSTSTGTLTAATTFTLSCTGAGGTTQQAVTITIDQPSAGGGGGGALDWPLLALLTGLLLCRPGVKAASARDASRGRG
jgi:hypothetical protein